MAILSKGTDFSAGDQLTAAKLDALVDDATFASGAVDSSTTQIDGSGRIIVKDGGVVPSKLSTGGPAWTTGGQVKLINSKSDISDFWGSGDNGAAVFTPYGFLGSNGSFGLTLVSNGYRNASGGFTSLGVNSQSNTSILELLPTGVTVFKNGSPSGTSAPESMRIDADGKVGIGTTGPDYALDVEITGGDTIPIGIKSGTTQSYLSIQDSNTTAGDVRVGSVGNNLSLWAGATQRILVKDDGNVGIGTANPINMLQVASNNRFFYVGESGVTNYAQAGFRQSDNKPAYGNFTGYDINFQTGTTDSGLATVMHLDNDGKVGIGTTNPSHKLEVNGDILIDNGNADGGQLVLASQGFDTMQIDNENGSFRVVNQAGSGTELLTVAASGNVGIGDTSPSSKLSVTGNATVSGNITTDSVIGAEDNNALRLFSDPEGAVSDSGGSTIQLFSEDATSGSNSLASQIYHNGKYHIFAPLSGSAVMSINSDAAQVNVAGQIEFDFLKGTGSVAITDIKDEDNMSSNSATALATQQSIKAYVDLFKPNIVQDTDTVSRTFSGSSSADFNDTELSLSITPRFSNSKFLINCSVAASTNSSDYPAYFRVLRDGSVVSGSVNTDSVGSNHVKMMFGANGGNTNQITSNASFTFLDGVASGGTSAITFKVQIASRNGGTVYMNRSKNFSNDASQASGISSLIVQEIYQ